MVVAATPRILLELASLQWSNSMETTGSQLGNDMRNFECAFSDRRGIDSDACEKEAYIQGSGLL